MFILREMTTKTGWASIRSRDRLKDIFKITSKKKRPEVITFTITTGEDTKRVRFIIPDARKEIQILKQFLIKSFGGDN